MIYDSWMYSFSPQSTQSFFGQSPQQLVTEFFLFSFSVKLLASLREEKKTVFHIFPDKDEAGERLYRQLLQAANEIGACLIRDELPEGYKDFGQWWAHNT